MQIQSIHAFRPASIHPFLCGAVPRRALAAAALLVATGVASHTWAGVAPENLQADTSRQMPQFHVEPETISLSGYPGEYLYTSFSVVNTGDSTLVANLSVSEAVLLLVDPTTVTVPPNDSVEVDVRVGTLPVGFHELELYIHVDPVDWDDLRATVLVQVSNYQSGDYVQFPDPVMKAVVREALGVHWPHPVTKDMMLWLTSLDRGSVNIGELENLSGIEHATNLQTLSLNGSKIRDLSPLSQLGQLRHLYLMGNRISDLTPLHGLTDLVTLEVNGNRIGNIDGLDQLVSLQVLGIVDNYLDTAPGSTDRAVLDALGTHAFVAFDPQLPIPTLAERAGEWGLPPGQQGDDDTNGPLQLKTILAYGMGLNPLAVTSSQLPQMAHHDAAANRWAFRYHRNTRTVGINTFAEISADLQAWSRAAPLQIEVLSETEDGRQLVEAVYHHDTAQQLFFKLLSERY